MKLEIDVNDEMLYTVIVAELDSSIDSLEDDLKGYVEGRHANVFFWGEPEKDIAKISEHINALKLVRSWYSIPEGE